jgi:hypothetical protein
MDEQDLTYFKLVGRIDRSTMSATWSSGYLMTDGELIERADLLVAMGETFAVAKNQLRVAAGLGDSVAAALTLIRSFDEVSEATIALGSDEHNAAARFAIQFQNALRIEQQGNATKRP